MYVQTGIKSNGDYADLNWTHKLSKHTFCFFLICVLLHEDAMFLHTQRRLRKDAGPTGQLVHCPVRVGGKGEVDCAFGRVSINKFFQFPRVRSSN